MTPRGVRRAPLRAEVVALQHGRVLVIFRVWTKPGDPQRLVHSRRREAPPAGHGPCSSSTKNRASTTASAAATSDSSTAPCTWSSARQPFNARDAWARTSSMRADPRRRGRRPPAAGLRRATPAASGTSASRPALCRRSSAPGRAGPASLERVRVPRRRRDLKRRRASATPRHLCRNQISWRSTIDATYCFPTQRSAREATNI